MKSTRKNLDDVCLKVATRVIKEINNRGEMRPERLAILVADELDSLLKIVRSLKKPHAKDCLDLPAGSKCICQSGGWNDKIDRALSGK